jgi:hypothetical protein
MKAALVVNCVTANTDMNFAKITGYIEQCAKNGAQLIVFGDRAYQNTLRGPVSSFFYRSETTTYHVKLRFLLSCVSAISYMPQQY